MGAYPLSAVVHFQVAFSALINVRSQTPSQLSGQVEDNTTLAPQASIPKTLTLRHLFKSHLSGFPEGTALLAFCCEFGLAGLAVNYAIAERLYILAAHRNSGFAQGRLAFLKVHGRQDIKINNTEASFWRSKCGSKNPSAFSWLEMAAEAGLAPAQFCMALCYYNGIATCEDSMLAFKWCQLAAIQGLAAAQNVLGNLYLEGSGCVLDAAIGLQWYTRAAEQHEAAAIYNIGTLFEHGVAVDQHFGRAYEWYVRAASYGSINAQNALGIFLEQGIGVDANSGKAVQYYMQAALSGHPHAQYGLAQCYHEGLGISRSDYMALVWFEKAAIQHHVPSMLSTAIAYEFGIGTKQKIEAAEQLYTMAALHGSHEAHMRLVPTVARRVLRYACVILPARPIPRSANGDEEDHVGCISRTASPDTARTEFCLFPAEIRRQILRQLDSARILTPLQMEFILDAAVGWARKPRKMTERAPFDAHTRRSSIPVVSLNVASSQASAARFVVEKLSQEVDEAIHQACSCLSPKCQKIKHVVEALGSLEAHC
ncbi:hypothetical protein BASA50_003064 [Batrachochytrium salamandrivorans]|uniref:Uncharacterized protein n=1 Tax=Batrachochytrium salamandrivorans TaxID=1357716 RepID=A0ABQ8FJH4_9FUNG|nr:hypothetical protein BASA50_003064 [Batrachochytrium salamandrivorans]KAH9268401.1 hypothetical protein BASA83_009400 [Batrachochytrium salamandrivorans]